MERTGLPCTSGQVVHATPDWRLCRTVIFIQNETAFPDHEIRKGSLILEISNSASDELLSRIGGLLGAE